ncbi:HEAT repeat domain-containing protein [Ectopseudomonas composti]
MQSASESTVLGDFTNRHFIGGDSESRFFRRDGGFWVNTTGEDGQRADFRVAYTIGVQPLQQYLLELSNGRFQAFNVAWDTQEKRWFDLYPESQLKEDLHWTGLNQNANFMCIDCHSTGFRRNYEASSQQYSSQWQALGVGCQSCHGPASGHLEWAHDPDADDDHGFTRSSADESALQEVETCGRCHSRRAALGDSYRHDGRLMDSFLPHILTPLLNEIDGKIKDEVFEYGSFVQSRMYAAGVRCSDCHDPHAGTLRAPGNALCAQCHNPEGRALRRGIDESALVAGHYDSPLHHGHEPGTVAAQCVSCHMPGRNYMVKDFRRDHSFSVPNPAQALALGHSDACRSCHQDMPESQLSERFGQLFGTPLPRDGGYATALFSARHGRSGAATTLLTQLARNDLPAIRRATLLAELPRYPSTAVVRAAHQALGDEAPIVREQAVEALSQLLKDEQLSEVLVPMLSDQVKAVRIAAAWALAQDLSPGAEELEGFVSALAEYEQVQLDLRERPEAYLNLAMLYRVSDKASLVEPSLREALRRNVGFHPARIALAEWLEEQGNIQAALGLLREGLAQVDDAALQYAIGMTLVRQRQPKQALVALRLAHELDDEQADYRYAYALGLYESGSREQAIELLEQGLADDPSNRLVRQALLAYVQRTGNRDKVQALIRDLQAINPDDPLLQHTW